MATVVPFTQPPPREPLLLSSWLTRKLPPRDFLLGQLLCTTSRWLINGETGVGKTLVGMDVGAAIAAGQHFLNWEGRGKPARVMYIDGELPSETFKERMELIASHYGPDLAFWGYCRDDIVLRGGEDIPPLNLPEGEAWLLKEIEDVKPDLIIFDSIMCLLTGEMGKEESWAPVKLLVKKISSKRVAQVWMHHTGHDATKGFGTKTREWEMDTVIMLSKADPEKDDGAIKLEFTKARLRTPANFQQFAAQVIQCTETGWVSENAPKGKAGKPPSEVEILRRECLKAYDRLADRVAPSPGLDSKPVRKVSVDNLRDELKSRGFLEAKETGGLTTTSRTRFHKAKTELISVNKFVELDELIWK